MTSIQKTIQRMHKGHDDQFDTEVNCSSNSPLFQGSHEESSSGIPNVPEAQSWKRDEEFYLEDGSCILLVEDTLFNVVDDPTFSSSF